MASIINIGKRKRGRPPTGATPILVRVQPEQLKAIEAWMSNDKGDLGHAEAIRRLVDLGLASTGPSLAKRTSKGTAHRAAELATGVIESRMAADATTEERETRKRRLVKGPSTFRDVRKDHPKK
jgi:hypothetical protein